MRKAINSALIYEWRFSKASTLEEVEERLRKASFYVVKPREDVLVATSLTNPFMVVFTFIQRSKEGGELLVVEAPWGWYGEEGVVEHMPLLEKIAGVEARLSSRPARTEIAP